jgi:hypothetical protein
VLAVPTAQAPKSFAIGITINGVPTHYLAKGGSGYGTTKISDAVSCSIDAEKHLICGKDIIGANRMSDMVALKKNNGQDITTGFSVDENNVLHWANNPKFSRTKEIRENQGDQARWALYPSKDGRYQLYAQLGCPNQVGDIHAFHEMMTIGTVKVIPL